MSWTGCQASTTTLLVPPAAAFFAPVLLRPLWRMVAARRYRISQRAAQAEMDDLVLGGGPPSIEYSAPSSIVLTITDSNLGNSARPRSTNGGGRFFSRSPAVYFLFLIPSRVQALIMLVLLPWREQGFEAGGFLGTC